MTNLIQDTFYVKLSGGVFVPAKYASLNGQYISDPNAQTARSTQLYDASGNPLASSNTNGYLIVPQDWTVNNALSFANTLIDAQSNLLDPSAYPPITGLMGASIEFAGGLPFFGGGL